MDTAEQLRLYAMLTDSDPEVRRQAHEVLDVVDVDVLGLLEEVFQNESLSYAWPDCLDLLMKTRSEALTRLGSVDPDFVLMKTLAAAPADMVISGLLADTLGLRPGTRLSRLTSGPASGPVPGIDGGGVLPAPDLDEVKLARIPVMVTWLASEVDWIRKRARERLSWYAVEHPLCRKSMAEMLRAVRRSGMPTRARRAALEALADIDWYEIERADRAILQRLIRIKLLQPEVLAPVNLEATWYALPTDDLAAVLDAFGLCDPVPVPTRTGLAMFDVNFCGIFKQVFVTPTIDGWTLVMYRHGLSDGPLDDSDGNARRRCAELSRRFGTAHWYTQSISSGCGDFDGWCVAEAGTIQAHYFNDHYEGMRSGPPDLATGQVPTIEELRAWVDQHDHATGHSPAPAPPPHPWQELTEQEMRQLRAMVPDLEEVTECTEAWLDPLGEDAAREEEAEQSLRVGRVASQLSVGPEEFGSHTRVHGTGVLAVPADLRHQRCGVPPIGETP